MKQGKDGLLLTVHGAMEFTWRYAWAGFVTVAILHHPFPLFEALSVYVLGAVVTLLSRDRGWRIISILVFQAVALALAAGVMVHAFYYKTVPFWSREWIGEFFTCRRQPLAWLILCLFFFWVLLFWIGGVTLIRKPPRYYTVCSRFDLGLAALFVLYGIEWLLLARGGIQTPDPIAWLLIFPYFCFSIFAIGLARNRDNEQREYLAGYRGIGMISTVISILALVVVALFLFLLPTLTVVAEMGYAVLKEAAEPMGPVLVSIIRFLILGRRGTSCCGPPSGTDANSQLNDIPAMESSWWQGILQHVVEWGFFGLFGVALLVLTVLGVWYLVRWLVSRTALTEKGGGRTNLISLWIERIRAALNACRARISGRRRRRRSARLYAGLIAWGRHSGIPHLQSETPGEYGVRLQKQFPVLQKEIGLIIELYQSEIYGERDVTERQWASVRSVRRRLYSPVNWPSRLRSWFFRPGITPGPGYS